MPCSSAGSSPRSRAPAIDVRARDADVDGPSTSSTTRRQVEPGALFCCVPGEQRRRPRPRRRRGRRPARVGARWSSSRLAPRRARSSSCADARAGDGAGGRRASTADPSRRPRRGRRHRHQRQDHRDPPPRARSSRPPGWPCGVIGTLSGARTTPEAPELQAPAGRLASTAARRRWPWRCRPTPWPSTGSTAPASRSAVFTNLSHDHLDYHGTMEAYFAGQGPAVRARAVRRGRWSTSTTPTAGCCATRRRSRPSGYSLDDVTDLALDRRRQPRSRWRGGDVHVAAGRPLQRVQRPGRGHGGRRARASTPTTWPPAWPPRRRCPGASSWSTPASPSAWWSTTPTRPTGSSRCSRGRARAGAGPGRVLVVFGCGGDRDRPSGPPMGEVAAAAGRSWSSLTSDNPRSEDPRRDHRRRARRRSPGRRRAVRRRARPPGRHRRRRSARPRPGDVVVIAGKGHETTQAIGDRRRALRRPRWWPASCWPARRRRAAAPVIRLLVAAGIALAVSLFGTRFLIDWLTAHRHRPADPRGRARRATRSRRARPPWAASPSSPAPSAGYVVAHVRTARIFTRTGSDRDGRHRRRRHRRRASTTGSRSPARATSACPSGPSSAACSSWPIGFAVGHRCAHRRAHRRSRSPAATRSGIDLGTSAVGRCWRVLLILGSTNAREPHRRARRAGRRLGRSSPSPPSRSSASGRSATRRLPVAHALDLAVVAAAMLGGVRRVPVVERGAGADLHGRHRLAGHRRRPGRPRADDQHAAAAADHRRPVRGRDDVGDRSRSAYASSSFRPRGSFRMAPMHHHFELAGWPETTVIIRFWILAGLCTAMALGIYYADFVATGRGVGHRDATAAPALGPRACAGRTRRRAAPSPGRWRARGRGRRRAGRRPARRRPPAPGRRVGRAPLHRGARRRRAGRVLDGGRRALLPSPGRARAPPGLRRRAGAAACR